MGIKLRALQLGSQLQLEAKLCLKVGNCHGFLFNDAILDDNVKKLDCDIGSIG